MPPRVHPGMLRRTRLLEALDAAAAVPLTVVNAGVGYGKTTLARSWCTERPEPVIWLTLDTADDDPVRLWTHLATGVERLGEGLGHEALSCLAVAGVPIETAVDELMNGLVAYGRPVTIVLDDLHAIRSEESLGSIAHAIERMPETARVVACTRSDPPLGLARLRASRSLSEIRAHDLAFTIPETQALMSHEGIELSADSVELVAARTEGWPAGLYLAALWLRDLDDPDGRVRDFAGSARQVGDYLTEEVLAALAPETREFLICTSVLARFTPELCDAVAERDDSAAVLVELSRSNMFLVSLDAQGRWYRYHHLFRDVLALELGRGAAPELRRRAAAWCQTQGLMEDAIEYAAASADSELVAELLTEHHLEFIWAARLTQLLGWIRWLSPETLERHPLLPVVGGVATFLLARPMIEIQQLLAVAERARQCHPELWSPYIEAAMELTRGAMIEGGDVGAAVAHGRRGVEAARVGAEPLIVGALSALGQTLLFAGEPDEVRRVAMEVVERPEAAERPAGYIASLGLLALVDAEQGKAQTAEAWALQSLAVARERFQAGTWVASLAHLGLAMACAATGRLDEAEREAMRGEELRRSPQPTVGHAHALLVLAQIRVARSRLTRAAADLTAAQRAIAEFADPGQLPQLAAAIERDLAQARAIATGAGPIEEPSPAELAVLRGLAAGLSRRQVGELLFISLNTVKSHTRELYRKLGVASQADAVARAEALGLLAPAESPG